MLSIIVIIIVSITAATGAAFAINYFLRTGLPAAFGIAAAGVGAFILFGVSGLWAGAHRDDWGSLTPRFALILIAVFLAIKFSPRIWAWWQRKLKNLLGE